MLAAISRINNTRMTIVTRQECIFGYVRAFFHLLNFFKKRCSSSHQVPPLVNRDKQFTFSGMVVRPVLRGGTRFKNPLRGVILR